MKLSEKRLAEMWCELNSFKVPDEIMHAHSSGIGKLRELGRKEMYAAMSMIEAIIGRKRCREEWNAKDEEE